MRDQGRVIKIEASMKEDQVGGIRYEGLRNIHQDGLGKTTWHLLHSPPDEPVQEEADQPVQHSGLPGRVHGPLEGVSLGGWNTVS